MSEQRFDDPQKLTEFDKISELNISGRYSYKPLYDYFQRLFLKLGPISCGFPPELIKSKTIEDRWKIIRKYLDLTVKDSGKWNKTMEVLDNMRQKVEHSDYEEPNIAELKMIREEAPIFCEWLHNSCSEYYKVSKNFDFKQTFYIIAEERIEGFDQRLLEFGDSAFIFKNESYEDRSPVEEVKQQRLELEKRLNQKDYASRELDSFALHCLIGISDFLADINQKENALLGASICPKCGGKIRETSISSGSTESDPEPSYITYRTGCEKCDYVLNSETIDV